MSLTIWRRGVMFIRLDEVTFTPPSPPKYFPPLIPKPCYRFLAEPQPRAAKSGSKRAWGAFDLRPVLVKIQVQDTKLLGLW